MIRVYFFASVKEDLDRSELILEWRSGSVGDLVSKIDAEHNTSPRKLMRENLLASINQEMVDMDFPVRDGDEVGFFPPVTGG